MIGNKSQSFRAPEDISRQRRDSSPPAGGSLGMTDIMPTPLQFLKESGIRPLHRRGQNFLIDKNILKKIMEAADIKKTDTILEIGSGSGELTCELAERAKKVFAVEIDRTLFEILSSRFSGKAGLDCQKNKVCHLERSEGSRDYHQKKSGFFGFHPQNDECVKYKNITLIQDDIRAIPNTTFGAKNGSYSVVANIPYHITSQIVRKFLEGEPRPKKMILLMQKEVAKRIVEKPPNMSLLAVSVQYYADAKLLFPVSRNSFFPKPNVDSAVIRLVVKDSFCHPERNEVKRSDPDGMCKKRDCHGRYHSLAMTDTRFFEIVRAGFSAKRKQCAQSISKKLHLSLQDVLAAFQSAGVAQKARAQEISVDQWEKIAEVLR